MSLPAWIVFGVAAIAVFGAFVMLSSRALPKLKRWVTWKAEPWEIEGDLFTLAEFRRLLTIYSMESDNGTGYWAGPNGVWRRRATGDPVTVDVPDLRRGGAPPEAFFTHIWYLGK